MSPVHEGHFKLLLLVKCFLFTSYDTKPFPTLSNSQSVIDPVDTGARRIMSCHSLI